MASFTFLRVTSKLAVAVLRSKKFLSKLRHPLQMLQIVDHGLFYFFKGNIKTVQRPVA